MVIGMKNIRSPVILLQPGENGPHKKDEPFVVIRIGFPAVRIRVNAGTVEEVFVLHEIHGDGLCLGKSGLPYFCLIGLLAHRYLECCRRFLRELFPVDGSVSGSNDSDIDIRLGERLRKGSGDIRQTADLRKGGYFC